MTLASNNTSSTRQYVPPVGARVKLASYADYHNLNSMNAPRTVAVWSWFTVRAVNPVWESVTIEHYNVGDTGELFEVPISVIAPPLGWQARYTIYCKPEKVDQVLTWFTRGIVVRQSHDMSGSMPTAFQPMDNSVAPHWQFSEVTDVVPAEQCAKVFRVVKVEREEIGPNVYKVFKSDCTHCHGTGRRTLAELSEIRKESIVELKHKMTIAPEPYRINESLHLEAYDPETETFECSCHWGRFRELGRSKRAKLIKEWRAEGWETRYLPYAGGMWERTRETVVKDWDE